MSQDLKAKVLQMILIPCFAVSFEKGQKIVGGLPAPYQDNPDNVVSVFINNVSILLTLISNQLISLIDFKPYIITAMYLDKTSVVVV